MSITHIEPSDDDKPKENVIEPIVDHAEKIGEYGARLDVLDAAHATLATGVASVESTVNLMRDDIANLSRTMDDHISSLHKRIDDVQTSREEPIVAEEAPAADPVPTKEDEGLPPPGEVETENRKEESGWQKFWRGLR